MLEKAEPSIRALSGRLAIWCLELTPPVPLSLDAKPREQAFHANARIVECNHSFEALCQHPAPLVGRALAEVPAIWLPSTRQLLRTLSCSGFAQSDCVHVAIDRQGKAHCARVQTEGLVVDGALHGLWGSAQEWPESHQERALLQRGSADPLFRDTAGIAILDSQHQLLRSNPAFERMGGIQALQDIMGFNALLNLAHESGHAQHRCSWNPNDPAGREVEISVTFESLLNGRFFLFLQDVNSEELARRSLGKQQTRVRQLARLQTVGQLVTRVAHELNQPLAAIVNYTRGSIRRLPPGDEWQAIRTALEAASVQAYRAGESIKRLRRLVKLGAPQLSRLKLRTLLEQTVELFRLQEPGHALGIEFDPRLDGQCIQADPVQIQQSLLILLENSAEAGLPRDSRVQISAWTNTPNSNQVVIRVRDNGPGVAKIIRERLFLPFESTKPGSSGLGLSIARTIVELHGGLLDCESWGPDPTIFALTLNLSPL